MSLRIEALLCWTLFLVVFGGPAFPASKDVIAGNCIAAIEGGDLKTAADIAETIKGWRNLFSPTVIKDAEACLRQATGDHWEYFPTRAGFLSGDEAREEQAYIDNAEARREEHQAQKVRWRCEVDLAKLDLDRLEFQYQNNQASREIEVLNATLEVCSKLYKSSRTAALTNDVCVDLFKQTGLPDTTFPFDYGRLEMARRDYTDAVSRLAGSTDSSKGRDNVDESWIDACRNLLDED